MTSDTIVLDRGWNRPLYSEVCSFCRHFRPLARDCAAFPDQLIPAPIWSGETDHREPYPGDHGIRFELRPGQSWLDRFERAMQEKFNPYHGPDGRFTTPQGAGRLGAWTSELLGQGGFSYNLGRGKSPRTGYMVSPYKDAEAVFDREHFSTGAINRFIAQHRDRLRRQDHYLGGWEYGGRIYLDISVRRRTKREAMEIARNNDQIAIYDVENGQELATADYWRRRGGKSGQGNRITFGRPAGEGLQDYKDWVLGTMEALGLDPVDDMSEEQWDRSWRSFWDLDADEEG